MAASARHWLMLVCAAAVATMLIAMGLLHSSSPRWHVSQEQEEEEAVHAARHDTSVAAVEQPAAEDPLTPSLAPSTLPPVLVASKSSVATPAAPALPTPSTPPAATIAAAAATTSTNAVKSTPRRPPWSLTLPEWMKHRPYLPPPLNATAPKLTKVQPPYHHS